MGSKILEGKRILLGITGGIASYKTCELLRMLKKEGADVHVMMTENAKRFLTPLTFETLSGNRVLSDLFDKGGIPHIEETQKAEAFVICPATANIIGKFANGIADDLISTAFLAFKGPVLIVPSMNVRMWEHTILRENIERLKRLGFKILEPEEGELACGEVGKGRLPELDEILEMIKDLLTEKDLQNERILVTAGATEEPIDPIRVITNRSSGKMGFAIAKMARRRGASVVLITGRAEVSFPRRDVKVIRVRSVEEMRDAVFENLDSVTTIIKAAAVSDFRCKKISTTKIKKEEGLILELEKTPDILRELGEKKGGRVLVGFAAETENLEENAKKKLIEKHLDIVVANDVSKEGIGFGSDKNEVLILFKDGKKRYVPPIDKEDVADIILDCTKEVQRNPY